MNLELKTGTMVQFNVEGVDSVGVFIRRKLDFDLCEILVKGHQVRLIHEDRISSSGGDIIDYANLEQFFS